MPSVQRTITVDQPVERVYAYLSDFTTTSEWDPPTKTTTRTSGDGGVGTTYHNVSVILGTEQTVDYVVTEHVVNRRFQLEGDAGRSLRVRDTMTFETVGTRTAVTYHAEFNLQGPAKVIAPLMPPVLKLLADKVAKSLEEHLTALA
ncbi:MAG: SRPBCC family protein [Nocardioides sp.]|uniref:SRPBCC family protein n=1 Tax=Nocardioides sp. TaxID=35761 RepID=UPI0039E61D5C